MCRPAYCSRASGLGEWVTTPNITFALLRVQRIIGIFTELPTIQRGRKLRSQGRNKQKKTELNRETLSFRGQISPLDSLSNSEDVELIYEGSKYCLRVRHGEFF